MSVFAAYADYYDLFYADKDYDAECDFVESVWQRFGQTPRTVLDIACGTGSHGLRLAARGYSMTGVDASAAMLARYQQKAKGQNIVLLQQNMQTLHTEQQFDAAVCLFDAIGYLTENADLASFLRHARACVKPGGLFVCDFWHAPALLRAHDPVRVREFPQEGGSVLRLSSTTLDVKRQTADVTFRILDTRAERVAADFAETHAMRFFLAQEMAFMLQSAGWQVRHVCPAFNLDADIGMDTWHLAAVASA